MRARCERCGRVLPLGAVHPCGQRPTIAEERWQEFERALNAWLETPQGRFAGYLSERRRLIDDSTIGAVKLVEADVRDPQRPLELPGSA